VTTSFPKICFAIVIYRIAPLESTTLRTLLEGLHAIDGLEAHILVLDNSPVPASDNRTTENVEYIAFGKNAGLAHAYCHAGARAKDEGAQFVVTLDQDSVVSPAYLASLRDHARQYAGQEVVFCPRIISAGRVVSPNVYDASGRPRFDGREGALHAINSFSVYATSLLTEKKIIDDYYWLDALDFAIYANLHRQHVPVIQMQVEVAHSLSVVDGGMNAQRLANMAHYEAAFLLQYCGPARVVQGLARLLVRIVRLGRPSSGIGAALKALAAGFLIGMRRRGHVPQV
jgi:hypothetical protein